MAVKKALAKFDPRTQIKARCAALGIPLNLLGRYSDTSSSEISAILSGSKTLTEAKERQLTLIVGALEYVAKMVSPLPVDFRKVEDVTRTYAMMTSGEFKTELFNRYFADNFGA